jgi:hypothetical protein
MGSARGKVIDRRKSHWQRQKRCLINCVTTYTRRGRLYGEPRQSNIQALRRAAGTAGKPDGRYGKTGNDDALIANRRSHAHAPSLAGASRRADFVGYSSIIAHCAGKARASVADFCCRPSRTGLQPTPLTARTAGFEILSGRPITKQRSDNLRFQPDGD